MLPTPGGAVYNHVQLVIMKLRYLNYIKIAFLPFDQAFLFIRNTKS